ncbi:MAG TPA: hypothetical protein VGE64_11305 [Xanthomonadaceae bacterium]
MQSKKTFAFQLASTQASAQQTAEKTEDKQWQVRDGVAVAGCTGPDARADIDIWGNYRGRDNGYWC